MDYSRLPRYPLPEPDPRGATFDFDWDWRSLILRLFVHGLVSGWVLLFLFALAVVTSRGYIFLYVWLWNS